MVRACQEVTGRGLVTADDIGLSGAVVSVVGSDLPLCFFSQGFASSLRTDGMFFLYHK